MILRQRFEDTRDRIILQHRKTDWIKDLNMNLITGKVIKSTYFLDEATQEDKLDLRNAFASEPGNRETKDCQVIENFVRTMTVFKPYKEFETGDF